MTADLEARKQIGIVEKNLAELASDYWGPNRDNGTRSIVRRTAERVDQMESEMQHYQDADRRETCYGLKAIEAHIKDHDKDMSDKVAIKVAEIESQGGVLVAKEKAKSDRAVQLLILAGVFASLFKEDLVKLIHAVLTW